MSKFICYVLRYFSLLTRILRNDLLGSVCLRVSEIQTCIRRFTNELSSCEGRVVCQVPVLVSGHRHVVRSLSGLGLPRGFLKDSYPDIDQRPSITTFTFRSVFVNEEEIVYTWPIDGTRSVPRFTTLVTYYFVRNGSYSKVSSTDFLT